MCRHYRLYEEDEKELSSLPGYRKDESKTDILPNTKSILVIKKHAIGIIYRPFGIKSYDKVILNARIETVSEKKIFQEEFKNSIALLPCSGFFESDRNNKEHYFFSDHCFYLVAIYYSYGFVILTTKANDIVGRYHNRMPLYVQNTDLLLEKDKTKEYILSLPKPPLYSEDGNQMSLF